MLPSRIAARQAAKSNRTPRAPGVFPPRTGDDARPSLFGRRIGPRFQHTRPYGSANGFGVFAVEDAATGRFLGQCGLNPIDELGEIEVLYALERAAWGRGLATEAAGAALAYGFGAARLERIVAVTRPEHTRSRHVLEKLGMRYEREVDVFGIHAVLYALTRDAFQGALRPHT